MRWPLAFCALFLAACVEIPEFGTEASATKQDYPGILPFDGLILQAMGPPADTTRRAQRLDAASDRFDARVARLNARAAILRNSPVNAETRARLAAF